MSKVREKVDAVIVGLGWAGSLMANELTQAGLNVVAIERGSWRDTSTDFPTTIDTDELRFISRRAILQPTAVETMTFRNNPIQQALPLREFNTYQFGWYTFRTVTLPLIGPGGVLAHCSPLPPPSMRWWSRCSSPAPASAPYRSRCLPVFVKTSTRPLPPAASIMIAASLMLLIVMEVLRRRGERLRNSAPVH